MTTNFKMKTARNAKYLRWVRTLPCIYCGIVPAGESHHENEDGHGAMGLKTSDYRALPCCLPHHKDRHLKGRSFFRHLDVEALILQFNAAYSVEEGGNDRG